MEIYPFFIDPQPKYLSYPYIKNNKTLKHSSISISFWLYKQHIQNRERSGTLVDIAPPK